MTLASPIRAGLTLAVLATLACMSVRPSHAAEPGYEIQVGVGESDNIERLPSGGTDETIATEEVDFAWHEKRPWFDADVDADVSHVDFLQHTYPDEFIGNFIGSSKVNFVPEVFSWDFADNFGQTPLNPLAPITPDNRENINYFSTGPVLSLPLAQELKLVLMGEYGRVDYEDGLSPLDNNRMTGTVGLLHQMSRDTNISVNVRDERVDFQNDLINPDYNRQEAFARFDTKGSRTELGVDLGYGRLLMSGADEGTYVARLDITRRVSPYSTVGLSFGHDYSDGADSFVLLQAANGANLNTPTALQTGAPFLITYASLAWNFERERTTTSLTASYFKDQYQLDSGLNNDVVLGSIRIARQVSPLLQVALGEYVDREHFTTGGDTATEADTGLQVTWRAGRSISVFFSYYLAKGFSDLEIGKFTENRVWLSIGYGRAAEVAPGPAPVRLPGQTYN